MAAVSAVMLAASGCHKDSFSFDEFTRPTISAPTTPNDDGENPDNDDGDDGENPGTMTPDDGDDGGEPPVTMDLPVVGFIATSNSVMEGGMIALTITSNLAAPAGGLSITIDISGNGLMTGEFTANAACTGLECVVIIPEDGMTVRLILTPLSDFSTEPGERWTATLVDTGAYNPAAGGDDNVGFDITDLIADIGIITSDTAVTEGGAIALTITSSIDAPAGPDGGLSVTVNIGGDAVAADFTSAACTNTQCVVLIPTGMRSVVLIITPLDDDAPEGGSEDWTATIVADDDIFVVDSDANVAPIAVANVLPPVVDSTDLDDLNTYATQTPLAAAAIRDGEDNDIAANAITGFQYDDAGGTRVLVERLEFGHLGIWINGDIADADFDFALLDENVVPEAPTPASNLATATYALEGEMTYNGNRFYPDGALMADFANAEVTGEISLDGAEAADDFGGTTLADGTLIADDDDLTLGLNAAGISGDAFSGIGNLAVVTAEGFFAPLSGRSAGNYRGRFNDAASYVGGDAATAAPTEVSGIFGGITDAAGNELNGGFLGQCSVNCAPNIGISSTDTTAQEGVGQIVLMITSDANAPSPDGLTVTINIGVAMDSEFTFTATGPVTCTNFPVCTVTIPAGSRSVDFILTPTSDSAAENSEEWTATLVDGDEYNLDAGNNNVAFDITDPTPPPANGTTLAELNNFDSTPTALAANVIRNRRSDDLLNGVAITASLYADASGMPQIYVQLLEFAALGIWVDGNAPGIGVDDYDYDYAFLGDNVVNSPAASDGRGSATYRVEGDATYRGLNFFPDGSMAADFDMRTFRLVLEAGDGGAFINDAFGGIDPSNQGDNFVLVVNGAITDEGFGASNFTFNAQSGFFSGLSGVTDTSLIGRFYDGTGYNPAAAAPTELAGVIETSIGGSADELNLGFLGRRP